MKNPDQISLFDDIDLRTRYEYDRKAAAIREKLRSSYSLIGIGKDMPDGLVVIVARETRTCSSAAYLPRWFRCVVGHHDTVSGSAVHLISCPDIEWPDEPVWQPSHGCRWSYPGGMMYTRQEFEPDIRWPAPCADCFKHCDSCGIRTGPYPRMKGGTDDNAVRNV